MDRLKSITYMSSHFSFWRKVTNCLNIRHAKIESWKTFTICSVIQKHRQYQFTHYQLTFLVKPSQPDQAIMHTISLVKSYPSCKEILNHLLQGITFAFDLKHAELKVIVKPTEDIPSIEEKQKHIEENYSGLRLQHK